MSVRIGWIVALLGVMACQPEALAEGTQAAPPLVAGQAEAVFAGGCFWCMEAPFDQLTGVISTTSGYTGGTEQAPAYMQVANKQTSHLEAIRVVYDPEQVTYADLLQVFWHNIDPTQADGQFCDRGPQYRSAIFVADSDQRTLVDQSREAVVKTLGQPVVTEVMEQSVFWEAEAYHQDFYRTNPLRYRSYRTGCGRDRRLQELWGSGSH
jgi:peptide-methionine (S)-S-oxide reductase